MPSVVISFLFFLDTSDKIFTILYGVIVSFILSTIWNLCRIEYLQAIIVNVWYPRREATSGRITMQVAVWMIECSE